MKLIGTKEIVTDRLILRRFTVEDADNMYERWAKDPEVTKYLTWPTHESAEVTRELLTKWVNDYQEPDFFNWAIELKGVGIIGSIGTSSCQMETISTEVGYCIGRAYWGQGIMTEALTAVLDYLFDQVGFRRVSAKHDVMNPGSGRVMKKAGMVYEGTLRQAGYNNRGIVDLVCYAMIREDRK